MLFNITNHQGNPNPDPSEISYYPSENSYSKRQQRNRLFGNKVPRFFQVFSIFFYLWTPHSATVHWNFFSYAIL